MKKYHYLRLRAPALLWPVGLIFSAIFVIRSMSFLPVLEISIWYWVIVGPLALISYWGIWTEIDNETLVYRVFFLPRLRVPIHSILRVVKGPPFGLARTDCMYTFYRNTAGEEKYIITVLFNHKPSEILKFISAIKQTNKEIIVAEDLKTLLEKQNHGS